MTDKLDFSLPTQKNKGSLGSGLTLWLLLGLTVLVLINLLMTVRSPGNGNGSPLAGQALTAEQTKTLATKLGQRNLYRRAAAVWQDYLRHGQLSDTDRAKALFQTGVALEKAGDCDQAIEYFYRSEAVATLEELAPEINTRIKQCFERLGKFSALRYELMDRTRYQSDDQTPTEEIVAEIGPQKITKADLGAFVEQQIENQLAPMAAFMSEEDINQQKKRMLEQSRNPQAQQQLLQQWLGQEVLYREALEQGMNNKAEVKQMLEEITRGVLAEQFMNHQLAAKINITQGDLQTYYQAHQSEYMDPAQATVRHILMVEESAAAKLIEKLKEGGDFGALAAEYSQAEDAKETQGQLSNPVVQGQAIADWGTLPELDAAIFAATPPAVLDIPFKSSKGWHIVKVEQKTAARQKAFDEVQQEVLRTLTNQKRQEVQQDLIQRMMDKFNVVIHRSTITPQPEPAEAP